MRIKNNIMTCNHLRTHQY